MDENIPRWVFASLSEHFRVVAAGIPIQYFVEGVDEDEVADFHNDNAVFRLNGPSPTTSSGITIWKLEIQILLTDLMSTTTDNAYSMHSWAGVFAKSMDAAIPIFKYGTGAEDDQTLLGCLEPDSRARESIKILNYGQVDITSRVKQSSVNGRFQLCVT